MHSPPALNAPESRNKAGDILILEFLSLKTGHTLEEICNAIRESLNLPTFVFGRDERAHWAKSRRDGVEYCISVPHDPPTFVEGGPFPDDACNVSVVLLVHQDHPHGDFPEWASNILAPGVAQRIADALLRPVVHHKTWLFNETTRSWSRLFQPAGLAEGRRPPLAPVFWNGVRPRGERPTGDWGPFVRVTSDDRCRPHYESPLDFAFLVHPRIPEEKARPFPESRLLSQGLIDLLVLSKTMFCHRRH